MPGTTSGSLLCAAGSLTRYVWWRRAPIRERCASHLFQQRQQHADYIFTVKRTLHITFAIYYGLSVVLSSVAPCLIWTVNKRATVGANESNDFLADRYYGFVCHTSPNMYRNRTLDVPTVYRKSEIVLPMYRSCLGRIAMYRMRHRLYWNWHVPKSSILCPKSVMYRYGPYPFEPRVQFCGLKHWAMAAPNYGYV